MLGGAVMSARWEIVADHPADRLRALPIHVPLMGPWAQGQPLFARLTPAAGASRCAVVMDRDAGLAIGVGPTVDRIRDHPMDAGIAGPAPDDVAIGPLGGYVEAMLLEPQERLTGTAELGHLVEHQPDRLLDTSIRILLQTIAHLHEADGRHDDQLAPSGLLVAGRQGALAQQVELVLVEATLEPEQQPIIPLPRRVYCLLIDQQGVDHAAHLDQLLPVVAVAGKAGDLPGRHRADPAEADFGYHSLEAFACHPTRRRTAQIVVHRFDLGPAQRREPLAHRILQGPALAVVQDLVRRGLPYVEHRLPAQMVRPDLLRHHGALPAGGTGDRRSRGR